MKIMFASDIHGSAIYCEKMLERYEAEAAGRLVLLGDILYHGPRNALPKEYDPQRVAELLNRYRDDIFCVRGNCDAAVDQMLLQFNILADYIYLISGDISMFVTHGHLYSPEEPPPLKAGEILIGGHTHIHAAERVSNFYYINPGSVSIPKNNQESSYMVLEDRTFIIKNIEGTEIVRIKV